MVYDSFCTENGTGVRWMSVMDDKIKVSVIIPVRNGENFLSRCLSSVINNNFSSIEIICVYDVSYDCSLEILHDFARRDRRVHVIENETDGDLSYSRNVGIRHSAGEYLFHLDCDDWITKDALGDLYTVAKENDLDVVYVDTECIFENEKIQERYMAYPKRNSTYFGVYTGVDLFREFELHGDHRATTWSGIYKRKFIMDHELFLYEGICWEDELYYVQTILSASRTMCLKHAYHKFFRHENSLSTQPVDAKTLRSTVIVYAEICRFLEQQSFSKEFRAMVWNYLYNTIYVLGMDYCIRHLRDCSDLQQVKMDNVHQESIYHLFMAPYRHVYCRHLFRDDMDLIKRFEYIIVYGAGNVGREMANILVECGVNRFYVAVTKKTGEEFVNGCSIHEIEEFIPMKKKSLVIISVSGQYYAEVFSHACELGFSHTISFLK